MSARHTRTDTDLGRLTLTAEGEYLTGVYFEGHWYPPTDDQLGSYVNASDDETLACAATELRDYIAGLRSSFSVPTRTSGDAFSEDVWRRLSDIPYGATTTYGELAQAMGDIALAQRVGQAVGHNPLSIVIPCHRVVGAKGALTGYAGGLRRKAFLLDLEAPAELAASRLF
ncbi:MAG: methylated-DNA--[protein]-cysteine S-methyltransferase [Actinomycetales bacterium]